ncbi:hypothetical protein EfmAA290_05240 [Enterococcus faecium]|nr:hypothetical protein EfmAA290_05240 [Enterococcus faecium]
MIKRPPINYLERKKILGTKIKAIRKSKKLTQPAFGLMINNGQLIDKKTIYEWEKGTYLPIPERLSRIADLGNMSIEELVCGNVEEYILGIILYRDSICQDGITFPDKNLFQHLRQQFPPVHSNLDTWLDRYSIQACRRTTSKQHFCCFFCMDERPYFFSCLFIIMGRAFC